VSGGWHKSMNTKEGLAEKEIGEIFYFLAAAVSEEETVVFWFDLHR
jgi:hypothetical protein